ncbi:MAG: glycerol-3-phosphate acyltransferase [Pseudomonadota bacterium]
MTLFFPLALLAYTAGSINFSILVFHLLGKGDPRDRFSKNPGATNVYRQLGLGWAALVLALDLGRAAALSAMGMLLVPTAWLPLLAFPLLLGNRYPLFHGFKGGKGVANFLGFCAVPAPAAALAACLAWVTAYKIAKQPFIGSFFMIVVLSAGLLRRTGTSPTAAAGTALCLGLIAWGHRGNVAEWRTRRKQSNS